MIPYLYISNIHIDMIVTTTEHIPNKEVKEIVGIARGSTVRARNIGRDITAIFKHIVGGELREYTELQANAREQAFERMVQDAEKLGADAVINVRISTSMITTGAAEILMYGTAVTIR
jgi:uncharacterized protein YbjQ (UPF0145 family)